MAEKAARTRAPPAAQRAPPQPVPAKRERDAASPATSTVQTLGNQAVLHAHGLGSVAVVSDPNDADEREANRLATAFVDGARVASAPAPGSPAHGTTGVGPGNALRGSALRDYERFFGTDLSGVRIHNDTGAARAAAGIGAQAFAEHDSIFFDSGRFDTGSRTGRHLLAHELAHVVQQRSLPPEASRLRRQPTPPGGPSGPGFVTPPELLGTQHPPSVDVPVEMEMAGPTIADPSKRRVRDTELLSFQIPAKPVATYLFYGIPKNFVFPTADAARASHLAAPAHPQVAPVRTPPPPPKPAVPPSPAAPATTATPATAAPGAPATAVPATPATAVTATPTTTAPATSPVPTAAAPPPPAPGPPAAAVGTTVYTPDGQAHEVLGGTPEAIVTATYTKYAVGAGSTTLLETGGSFIVIDAGTFGPAGTAVADATMRALKARIGPNGVISQILITHAHADHMDLLPRLAVEFRIAAIRINALQADRPEFQAALEQVRQAHQARINAEADRVRAELAAERRPWEAADRGDPLTRQRRWNELRDQRVRAALDAIPDIVLERLVPGVRGRLAITALPVDMRTFTPQTAGTPTDALAPGVRAPAVVDPAFADELGERGTRGPTGKQVDRFSSSWVVDVRGQTRFLVLPDIRGEEFESILRDFRSAAKGLGMEANFQVWDVGHHMQIGWSGGGTAAPGAPSVRATQLGHISRFLHTMRAGTASTPGTDVVVVSAYEGFSRHGTSYVDPAHVWLLKSLGFKVFLATAGHDVQVLQVVTSQGQRVTGVVGAERGGAQPREQLLRRTEAALAELRDAARLARAEMRRARAPADRAAAQARLDAATARTAAIDRLRLEYLDAIHSELARSTRGGGAGRPAVAPAVGAPEPAQAQATALSDRLTAEGFTRPVPTTGDPRFTEAALAIVRPGLLDPNAPAGSAGARALEIAETRSRIREIEQRPADPLNSARNRAELLAELHRYRIALEEQVRIPDTTGSTRAVLDDELRTTRDRIKDLTPGPETRTLRQRLAGTGALVDTQIVAPQRMAPAGGGPEPGADATHPAATVPGADRPAAAPDVAPEPRPGLGQRSGAAIQGASERGFGALMIYQTFTAETDVLARASAGQASGAEVAATTAHSALGITVGYKMLRGTPVSNAVFVVLSVLEVVQAASRDYATPDQRNTEIAYAALRGGVNLGLTAVGAVVMAVVPPPIGVLAGLGIMLLGDSILEALGAHDWIERLVTFQPRQVTAVEQKMRDLLAEYEVIVGAIELAERSDPSLRAVGASDPGATRQAANKVADMHRIRAIPLERNILSAFKDAYDRAQGAFAGLAELDEMRRRFYELMQRAHPHDEEIAAFRRARAELLARYDLTEDDFDETGYIKDRRKRRVRQWVTDDERQLLDPVPVPILDQARTSFEEIERSLSLANAMPADVAAMEQWGKIDRKLDELNNLLVRAYFTSDTANAPRSTQIDPPPVKDFVEIESEAHRMLDNARYRVRPPTGSYRTEPIIPPTAPGYGTYKAMLEQREQRMWWTQHRISEMNAGRTPTPKQENFELGQLPNIMESQPAPSQAQRADLSLRVAESALGTYQALVDSAPKPPADLVRAMFTNSADAGSAYAAYLGDHGDYSEALRRIEVQQTALAFMTEHAQQVVDPAGTLDANQTDPILYRERLRQLMINVRSIIVRRHDELGMVFPSESAALVSRVREKELAQLNVAMGVDPDVTPLSGSEQHAAREALIRDTAPQLGSTADRLAQIPELRRSGQGGLLTGIYRLRGWLYGYELPDGVEETQVADAENALVGDLGAGHDDTRGFRRLRKTHETRRVIALNAAAVRILRGTEVRQIRRANLHQITMGDLHP